MVGPVKLTEATGGWGLQIHYRALSFERHTDSIASRSMSISDSRYESFLVDSSSRLDYLQIATMRWPEYAQLYIFELALAIQISIHSMFRPLLDIIFLL